MLQDLISIRIISLQIIVCLQNSKAKYYANGEPVNGAKHKVLLLVSYKYM